MRKPIYIILLLLLTIFGLITLFLSSSVIFDWLGIREAEGNYVEMVVWANFFASILYLTAAYALVLRKKWSLTPLFISAIILIAGFGGLLLHIRAGGLHETKTIYAMMFRITLTLVFTFAFYKLNRKILVT